MKKLLILLASAVLLLSACGEVETKEKDVGSVESSDKAKGKESESKETEEAETEIEKVVADDEYIKATLVSIEHKVDDLFDEEKYVVNITLENKTENKIMVQARDVSIDGTMVDDMVMFSQDVAGNKKANGKLEIQNYDGDLPEMNEDIEFTLTVIDEESFDTVAEHEVNVDF